MGSRLNISPPADFCLPRDVCSNGIALLAPNRWSRRHWTLSRPLSLAEGPAEVVIAQPGADPSKRSTWGGALRVEVGRALSRAERRQAEAQIRRMLCMDDDAASLHRVDPRWKRSGRGRIFRSPTFFEDVVKTITTCNVQWGGTVAMNAGLCALSGGAFPTPAKLARTRPATLREKCRVGYRDKSLIAAAKLFAAGQVEEAPLADPQRSDDEVEQALRAIPGVGPYAAAHLLQTLGRYSRLAIDTEAIKHAQRVLGLTGDDRALRRKVEAHYARFGNERFRVYWFELLGEYEKTHGPPWTWADEDDSGGAPLTRR